MRGSAHSPIFNARKSVGTIAPANSIWSLPDPGGNPGGGGDDDPTTPVDPSDPPPEAPASGVIDMIDFLELDDTVGRYYQGNLVGDGQYTTRYILTASTKASQVPTAQGLTSINLFRGHFAGRTTTPFQPTLLLSDFGIDMSDVPHNVGGIQVGYIADLTVQRLLIMGTRGSSSSPPGETFAFSAWHCLEMLMEDCVFDGRNASNTLVGATLFGINSSANATVNDCVFNYARYGFGIANWKGSGVNVFNNIDLQHNRRAVNHENCAAGSTWTYNAPDCRNQLDGVGRPQFVINGHLGSANLIIDEPIWDRTVNGQPNPFRVGVMPPGNLYLGQPANQLVADVDVRIDGVWYNGATHNSASSTLLKIGPYW